MNEMIRQLELLSKYAPDMRLHAAMDFARRYANLCAEQFLDAEALAVLSETMLGFNSQGGPSNLDKLLPPTLLNKHTRAVKRALQRVQQRHAWVVCGPVSNAMEKLLEKKDAAT